MIVIVIVVAVVGVVSYFLLKGGEGLTHDRIFIEGNDDFIPANGVIGGSGTESDPYIIENWAIDASTAHGIEIRSTTAYFVIRNCVVESEGKTYYGIYLDNVRKGKVMNNTCKNNDLGIYLYNSSDISLDNNICSSNSRLGILLEYSSNNTLSNNICENNILGIQLSDSNNNTLDNNTCSNNDGYGIWLDNSDNNTLDNITCKNNHYGIHLYYSCNNTLTNNICKNNDFGIYLEHSGNNFVSKNIVEKNDCGIYLCCLSDNNLISNNNFLNNASQAYDLRTNCWDNGYPSGGNYWSDYTGEDEDGDGIGDIPYHIPGDNNQDRYPLMNPV